MKITKYQSDDERSLLTGMVISDRVLGNIHTHLRDEPKPFRSTWGNLVARWCLDYFAAYQKAPRSAIQSLFSDYAKSARDEDSVALVEKFLVTLSNDHETSRRELNEDHLIDTAARFFNTVRLERLSEDLESDLAAHDTDAARERVEKFHPVALAMDDTVSVFTDRNAWREAIEGTEEDAIIQYPGAVGEFFGRHLCRDSLVSILAPEKRGKSWWLIDAAWRGAVFNRRRVMFYSVGDMSKKQMMRRFASRAARRPVRAGVIQCPTRITREEGDEIARVEFEDQEFREPLTVAEVDRAMSVMLKVTARNESLLKLRCTANSTTTVSQIDLDLKQLEREGWVPDAVVIDYADILAPENSARGFDFRHQINETWKALRRLSQEHHCCVLTATQSDAVSYTQNILRSSNFSEDKRKLSHVTGMFGLNQTEDEKKLGIYRLNWIELREDVFYVDRCVTVASCLAIANPCLKSTW